MIYINNKDSKEIKLMDINNEEEPFVGSSYDVAKYLINLGLTENKNYRSLGGAIISQYADTNKILFGKYKVITTGNMIHKNRIQFKRKGRKREKSTEVKEKIKYPEYCIDPHEIPQNWEYLLK
jgi:hypothetical protein